LITFGRFSGCRIAPRPAIGAALLHFAEGTSKRNPVSRFFGHLISRCTSKCPTCGETCIAGVHGTGGHYCANGHTW